ncbi:MAG: Xaa-Pro peptidase family protein [Roseiarcus sp.]
MSVHFSAEEMSARKRRLQQAMAAGRLDGMLLFAQESMFWLTGYDTFGFCFFQCLYFGADGRTALLTRSADLRQAQRTSDIADVRIWRDSARASPAMALRTMLEDLGARGRLGVENDSQGLTHYHGSRLERALDGLVTLVDASRLVAGLRATKSAAELAFVRAAAQLSDRADRAAIARTAAGADEGAILAAMHAEIFEGGGDYPGNEFIIGSGEDALLCRYKSGRRRLEPDDQLTLEFAGVYRHYHAAIMRTHIVGRPRPLHRAYHAAAREALEACEAELRPGRTAGDVFAAHARVFDAHGLSPHRLNACGYALGAKFTPSWMDAPMFYDGNPFEIAPSQVYFLHMILMDSDSRTAMCLGRTYLVGAAGAEPLNAAGLDLVVK